jgi:tetratricopeptide (TPR) repeat protein
MKRKYETRNDDEINNSKHARMSVIVEQPSISHFDTNTVEYWKHLVNAMRASDLQSELRTIYGYLHKKSISIEQQMKEQLHQIQIENDMNVYYYLVQYGIMRLDEDIYERNTFERLTDKLLSMHKQESCNVWISNLYLMFLLRLGHSYSNTEEFDKVFSCGETVVKMFPNFLGIYSYMAFNLLKAERYEESIHYFDRAIGLPDLVPALYSQRASAKFYLSRYEEAIKDFDKAIELDSTDIWPIFEKGRLYEDIQDHDLAIECFTRVLAIDPGYLDALDARADNYRVLGLHVPALHDARQSYLANNHQKERRPEVNLTRILSSSEDPLFQ